jgi:hypothetical protein
LPAETRKQQAQLFNDPDSGHDVLVATDAIGMGLNLNIRRIIFSDVEVRVSTQSFGFCWIEFTYSSFQKNDGTSFRQLYPPEVKQIAGRAGRYRSDHPIGYVTAFTYIDLCVAKCVCIFFFQPYCVCIFSDISAWKRIDTLRNVYVRRRKSCARPEYSRLWKCLKSCTTWSPALVLPMIAPNPPRNCISHRF